MKGNLAGSCPSVLARYWTGRYRTLGLRTGSVRCQYRANPRPGTNCPVEALLLVYNWRDTLPFLNTGMNPTFPPGPQRRSTLKLLSFFLQGIEYEYHPCARVEKFHSSLLSDLAQCWQFPDRLVWKFWSGSDLALVSLL